VTPPAHVDAVREHPTFFDDDESLLKISATSPPHPVATALVRAVQEGRRPIMRAIGHGAVGQAVKAQIIARGIAGPLGIDLVYIPAFDKVPDTRNVNNTDQLSAVVWRVLWR
jgi:stage V sporulation protein S